MRNFLFYRLYILHLPHHAGRWLLTLPYRQGGWGIESQRLPQGGRVVDLKLSRENLGFQITLCPVMSKDDNRDRVTPDVGGAVENREVGGRAQCV